MGLKEDRSLFARLMMICKNRPDIDIKEAIGLYEFTVVVMSLFAGDGTMMHCSCKSTLMHIPKKQSTESSTSSDVPSSDVKVAIVNGTGEVQSLDKPDWIKTCKDLAEHFIAVFSSNTIHTQQICLAFDRYNVLSSLKSVTWSKRQDTQEPVYYHTTNSTRIAKVTMKKLISHTKTKAGRTAFLAQKVMERGQATRKQIIVTWTTSVKHHTRMCAICRATTKKRTQRLSSMR